MTDVKHASYESDIAEALKVSPQPNLDLDLIPWIDTIRTGRLSSVIDATIGVPHSRCT